MGHATNGPSLRGGTPDNGWQARRDRALQLRRTCTSCAREDVEPRVVVTKTRTFTQAGTCECGERAFQTGEIARALGCGMSTVAEYLNDPRRERTRDRKEKYKGTCAGCGGPCDGRASGVATACYRCRYCLRGEISPHTRATSPTGFRDFTKATCGWGGPARHCRDEAPCPEPKRPGGHLCERHAAVVAPAGLEALREASRWRRDPLGSPDWEPEDFEPAARMAA